MVSVYSPLRIGLGGGGSDIYPSNELVGSFTNITINKYVYCSAEITKNKIFSLHSVDQNVDFELEYEQVHEDFTTVPEAVKLHAASLKVIFERFGPVINHGLTIKSSSEYPVGTGLGCSSSLTVAILVAILEVLEISATLTKRELFELSLLVEREKLKFPGGVQDAIAPIYGGCNFVEWRNQSDMFVESVPISYQFLRQLSHCALLISTGNFRNFSHSSRIRHGYTLAPDKNEALVHNSRLIRQALLRSNFDLLMEGLIQGWEVKKEFDGVLNPEITKVIECIENSPAKAFKLCGAGGGGYFLIFASPDTRVKSKKYFENNGYQVVDLNFVIERVELV
ncbi:hypothetical protein N9W76_00705 [Planktomarina temperata]|nr:hypothetical protein [Planktomarina temperata]